MVAGWSSDRATLDMPLFPWPLTLSTFKYNTSSPRFKERIQTFLHKRKACKNRGEINLYKPNVFLMHLMVTSICFNFWFFKQLLSALGFKFKDSGPYLQYKWALFPLKIKRHYYSYLITRYNWLLANTRNMILILWPTTLATNGRTKGIFKY